MANRSTRRWRAGAVATIAGLLLVSACSSSTDTAATSTTAATTSGSSAPSGTTAGTTPGTTVARPMRILVTNDDGYGAEGIDVVVEALRALPDVEVTVVAPEANQSGTGGKTTDGPLTVTEVTTASGYQATAVTGFPADTIIWAIDQGGVAERPDLVVSGINFGQNLGPLVDISGTVGAARAAAARGIPAIASSQGIADPLDYPAGAKLVVDWVTEHRADIMSGAAQSPILLQNLNIPSCTTGTLHELVDVPVATDVAGRQMTTSDCTGTPPAPTDDIGAFITGFPSLSDLSVQPTTPS